MRGKELAAALNVSPSLVSTWAKEGCPVEYMGKVQGSKRGACPRYRIEDVRAWLKQRNEAAQEGGAE